MNNFLKESRKLRHLKDLFIVLGNESCDLDSAVSTICLAFHLNKYPKRLTDLESKLSILPVLNIPRVELPLKTEVTYFLKENKIDLDSLICRDEISFDAVKNFILVDHHVTPYSNVQLILDHRPIDVNSQLPAEAIKVIEQVGSCSTLVTRFIRDTPNFEVNSDYEDIMRLLYGAIVIDTVNFSDQADRARPLDYEMAEYLENNLKISNILQHRQQLFDRLNQARADIATLDSYQILLKDFKMISNSKKKIVALPGYPILVQDYIHRNDNVEKNFTKFVQHFNADVVIMIGFKVHLNRIERDIGIVNIKNTDLFNEIVEALIVNAKQFNFMEVENCNFRNGKFYRQTNVKLSRKQILPIVKSVLDKI